MLVPGGLLFHTNVTLRARMIGSISGCIVRNPDPETMKGLEPRR
jgi:hypothetical protein